MQAHKTVDDYLASAEHLRDELRQLREILSATELEETVKWGAPCYTLNGKNVIGLVAFKSYVGLWFYQGALLKDPENVLVNAQEGKTKAQRQWRFRDRRAIRPRLIKAYVKEAIDLAARGVEIKAQRGTPVEIPVELKAALKSNKKASGAFTKLTPGRRREYAEYIAAAKREATKHLRIEKILPMIEAGSGLHDKYR